MLIKTINERIKSDVVPAEQFFADMNKMYLSRFSVDLLRDHFTEKERKKIMNQKKSNQTTINDCEKDWPICITNIVKNSYYHKSPSFYIYREDSILSNFKPRHFFQKPDQPIAPQKKHVMDRTSVRNQADLDDNSDTASIQYGFNPEKKCTEENYLLIERQVHKCVIEKDQRYRIEKQSEHKALEEMISNFKAQLLLEERKALADDAPVPGPDTLAAPGIKWKLQEKSKNSDDEDMVVPEKGNPASPDKKRNGSLQPTQNKSKERQSVLQNLKKSQRVPHHVETKPASKTTLGPQMTSKFNLMTNSDDEVEHERHHPTVEFRNDQLEIDSDDDEEDEEDSMPTRDVRQRMTFYQAQLGKIGGDDFTADIFKSILAQNTSKFEQMKLATD